METLIANKTREIWKKACAIWPFFKCGPMPSFDLKLRGRAVGKAYLDYNFFRINREMAQREGDALINRTVPHEIAHLIAWKICKDKGHGEGWKKVMRLLGLEPIRCHTFQVPGKNYLCACSSHSFSTRRHNSAQRGAVYFCKKCKKNLVWEKLLTITTNQIN